MKQNIVFVHHLVILILRYLQQSIFTIYMLKCKFTTQAMQLFGFFTLITIYNKAIFLKILFS